MTRRNKDEKKSGVSAGKMHEETGGENGLRVLVDRIWPCGMTKAEEALYA